MEEVKAVYLILLLPAYILQRVSILIMLPAMRGQSLLRARFSVDFIFLLQPRTFDHS